jgi:hypothetical protein
MQQKDRTHHEDAMRTKLNKYWLDPANLCISMRKVVAVARFFLTEDTWKSWSEQGAES